MTPKFNYANITKALNKMHKRGWKAIFGDYFWREPKACCPMIAFYVANELAEDDDESFPPDLSTEIARSYASNGISKNAQHKDYLISAFINGYDNESDHSGDINNRTLVKYYKLGKKVRDYVLKNKLNS